MRIALGIEYDGSRYHGWQMQEAGVDSVQARVDRAVSCVADHPVTVEHRNYPSLLGLGEFALSRG